MVTGASTADVAVILLDARKGVLEQSKRHAFISALLGIPQLVVAVNKMDLVDYSQERFEEIVAEFEGFAPNLREGGRRAGDQYEIIYMPISALNGDNVVERSERMPWLRPAHRRCWSCSSRSRSPTTTPTTARRGSPCSG